MFELNGKTALVTGSSKGIGKGIALGLARAGANVVLNSYTAEDDPESTIRQIQDLGREAAFFQADVTSEREVAGLFEQIDRRFGRLDILVNNAGTSRPESILETEIDSWRHVIDTNLTSCFLCSKQAMERMVRQSSGRIVQISSVVAHQGAIFGHVHYAATKSGMLGFTKSLARTAAPHGITVNAVAPGIIDTELLRSTHGPSRLDELSRTVPLGLGSVEDVAAAVVFLASEEARYLTGITIDVNGGLYYR
ncbi:short-chain dehydrogenase [Cohnella sp. CIP 111063]|uniref:SDR family NAD(P)-dependent oxidoreductase n=1 Tax=unclassified Cohnella TaxID=2636738 RepID=UPI000B8C324F|nr:MULTISPECIES: 3-oxoacyl-ACP reductase family protein [unclassified Cohnella]OXS55365.1 short-chain dehydrogenase [Cohnella sp. CIP 111063]PRX65803.1 3-oxoacyl-[acyl-carrier protein] reductase [Cohnella sp. SGD-V74]